MSTPNPNPNAAASPPHPINAPTPQNTSMGGMPIPPTFNNNPYFQMPPFPPPLFPLPPGMHPPPSHQQQPQPPPEEKDKTDLHVITLHPRGLPQPFDVPFPERRLPVCDKCKKNYKSRDLCRTRDGHKTLPWTTTHVAITIDESLINPDDNTIKNIPTIGLLMDTPLLCLGPADGCMKSEPICKVCREKNYTKDYCRNTCRHTTPPWNTTYVKIVADTREEGERARGYGALGGSGVRRQKRRKKNVEEDEEDGKVKSSESLGMQEGGGCAFKASYEGEEGDILNSDDLTVIHKSRTFLAAVSSKSVIVKWCERIQYPESAENTTLESAFQKLKQNEESSKANNKSTNQSSNMVSNERLWEAFRAGVMWATHQQQGMMMSHPGPFSGYMPPPVPGGEMHPNNWGGSFVGYPPQMNSPMGGGQGGMMAVQGHQPQDGTFESKNIGDENDAAGGEEDDADLDI